MKTGFRGTPSDFGPHLSCAVLFLSLEARSLDRGSFDDKFLRASYVEMVGGYVNDTK